LPVDIILVNLAN